MPNMIHFSVFGYNPNHLYFQYFYNNHFYSYFFLNNCLLTVISYYEFLSNTNNLHIVIWFHLFSQYKSFSNRYIWPTDETVTGTTSPCQSEKDMDPHHQTQFKDVPRTPPTEIFLPILKIVAEVFNSHWFQSVRCMFSTVSKWWSRRK